MVAAERQLLQVFLQAPALAPPELDLVPGEAFARPEHRALHDVLCSLGGASAGAAAGTAWAETVTEAAGDDLRPLVNRLAVSPLPADGEEQVRRLAASLTATARQRADLRREGDLRSRAQRLEGAGRVEAAAEIWAELSAMAIRRQAARAD